MKTLTGKGLIDYIKEQPNQLKSYIFQLSQDEKDELLVHFVKVRKLDVVKELVEQGADIHVKNELPLWHASINGDLELVKYLVAQGANIHAGDIETEGLATGIKGLGPEKALRAAATSENGLEVVKYLVGLGADIHAVNDKALYLAAINGHLDIVQYLIEQGANIHAEDEDALRWAIWNGKLKVAKCLIDHGADIHLYYDEALSEAKRKGYSDIVNYLESII